MELQEAIDHLNVQANAAMKVSQIAIELMLNLAAAHGLRVDLKGAAAALDNSVILATVDPETAEIERRARMVAASILLEMQSQFDRLQATETWPSDQTKSP